MKKISFVVCGFIIFCFVQQAALARNRVTAEYQFDTRDFNTLNFTGFTSLPANFEFFGFVDIETQKRETDRLDGATYFMELDLRSPTVYDFGILAELNSASGINNDIGRLGFFLQPEFQILRKHNLWVLAKVLPVETDGIGWQASLSWNKKFPLILGDRFSMGGFFDYNFRAGNDKQGHPVSDTQFRFSLTDQLSLLVEYRHNDLLPSGLESGVGFGFQWCFCDGRTK